MIFVVVVVVVVDVIADYEPYVLVTKKNLLDNICGHGPTDILR